MKLNEILKEVETKKIEKSNSYALNKETIPSMKEFFMAEDPTLSEEGYEASMQFLISGLRQNKDVKEERKDVSKEELLSAYQLCTDGKKTDVLDESKIYRQKEAYIFHTQVKASDAEKIEHFMEHFMSQMHYSKNWMHEIEFAAMSHKRIIDIQPFCSHNTFMAFWLLNRILLSCGYPPVVMTMESFESYKQAYFATRSMNNPDIDGFIGMIAKNIRE